MKIGTSSTGTPLGVFASIEEGLAAITPEQLIVPSSPHEEGDHIVAIAGDRIKRLLTLRRILKEEADQLADRGMRLSEATLGNILGTSPEEVIKELEDPGSPLSASHEAERKLFVEFSTARRWFNIVSEGLRLEIGLQYTELADKKVIVRNDWSLCWRESADEDEMSGRRIRILAIGGDLAELLSGDGGNEAAGHTLQ